MEPPNPVPDHEAHRLAALARFNITERPLQAELEPLTRLAAYLTKAPWSLVNIIDQDRQVTVCATGLEARIIPRYDSLCAYTIMTPDVLHVPDLTKDPRFVDHPIVTKSPAPVRMYAGAPLITDDGQALGVLCVVDQQPRQLDEDLLSALKDLAQQVIALLELRRHSRMLSHSYANLESFADVVIRDIHQPLQHALGLTEMATDYVAVGSFLSGETLQQLHETLTGIDSLLAEMVSYAPTGPPPSPTTPIDLTAIAHRAAEQVLIAHRGKTPRILIEQLPTLQADPQLIGQLLTTLLAHTALFCAHTPEPLIQLSARKSGVGWVIMIDDNGAEVSGHEREHTLLQTAPTSEGGPANRYHIELGLAVCRHIVEFHQGHLWIEESDLGGAKSCLYLPAQQNVTPSEGSGHTISLTTADHLFDEIPPQSSESLDLDTAALTSSHPNVGTHPMPTR